MVESPRPGQPDDAAREAALRMLVDALSGPSTPEELAREHAYVEAFRALSTSARAAAAARRRRRLRLAAVGGFAALAVSGTAAAITGTYPGVLPAPSRQSLPLRHSTAPSSRPGTTAPQPGDSSATTAPAAPTTGGGTDAPPASLSPSASASGSPFISPGPTPTVSGAPGTPPVSPSASPHASPEASADASPSHSPTTATTPTPSPTPSPSASQSPLPEPRILTAYCEQYLNGKVKKGSPKWKVLVLAAGAQSNVRAYCQGLVRRSGTTTSGGGTTTSTG